VTSPAQTPCPQLRAWVAVWGGPGSAAGSVWRIWRGKVRNPSLSSSSNILHCSMCSKYIASCSKRHARCQIGTGAAIRRGPRGAHDRSTVWLTFVWTRQQQSAECAHPNSGARLRQRQGQKVARRDYGPPLPIVVSAAAAQVHTSSVLDGMFSRCRRVVRGNPVVVLDLHLAFLPSLASALCL